jgi:hypothetical protein
MSAGTAMELDPGSRMRSLVVEHAPRQLHTAVPEAIAETPVKRWIPFPEGEAPWSCRVTGRELNQLDPVLRSPESGSTKVPSQ